MLVFLKLIFYYNLREVPSIKNQLTILESLVMRSKETSLKHDIDHLALVLLLSLPARYTDFVNSLIYGWEAITLIYLKTYILIKDSKMHTHG